MERVISLNEIGLYNPQRQSAEVSKALFVVRQKQFNSLIESITAEERDSRPQHYLIVGQRGMGKSTLLKRIEVELHDEPYRKQFIPLLFPEEQYNVKNLATFWLNCLDALANSLEAENDTSEIIAEIDKTVKKLSKDTLETISEDAYKFLMNTCQVLQRRPVLLVDNIDLVFNRLEKGGQHDLRSMLNENGAPIIVAGGLTATSNVTDYDMPFFDFFQTEILVKLNYEEFVELLTHIAVVTHSDKTVLRSIQENSARQKSLLELTGGNPRITIMLFKLIVKGFANDISIDLEALADEVTPLYKAKYEDLSEQQQIIVDAVAMNWDAISLNKLSQVTGYANNQLSPQLKRLTEEGWLETTPAYKAKGNAYLISERFFNIWYLIRCSRRHKEGVFCLSRFLERFYGKEEMDRISDSLLKQEICNSEQMRLHLAVSMMKVLKLSKRKKHVEKTFKTFLNNDELRKEFDVSEKYFLLKKGEMWLGEENYKEAISCFDKVIDSDEQEKCAWCLKGKSLLESGKHEEALECFNKFTEIHPQEVCAWIKKGNLLFDLERFDEAIICFDNALEINPTNELALGRKGDVFEELEQYENAIACFNEILKDNPKNDSVWIQKGKMLNELNQYNDALICFDKAIELKSKNKLAWMRKGETLCNLTNYNEAIVCFDKVLKINSKFEPAYFFKALSLNNLERYEDAVICFNKAIKLNPTEKALWFEKGKTLENLQRVEEAIECFDETLILNPNFEPAWFFKGKALVELEHYEDALLCFDKCIEFNSEEEMFYYNKGEALKKLERYEEAIIYFEESIKLNSEDEDFWFEKGMCLFNLQRYENAIESFNEAIKLNSSFFFYWAFKGLALDFLQRYEEAIECYDQAIECYKLNPKLLNLPIDIWSSKGLTLYCLKHYEEANNCYEESVKLNPKDANNWSVKGDCLQEMQRYEDAIVCYDKAIELNPNDSVFWNDKGYTLINLQCYEDAISCFDKAIELDANNDSAMGNKGYALIELKKYIEAAEFYEQSISVNPQNLISKFHLIFLYRDKLRKREKAVELFNSINEQEINQNENRNSTCRYYLNKAIFELYNQNKGIAKEHLLKAFEVLEKENELMTMAKKYWWVRFGYIVIELGYGSWLLEILKEKGYDVVLSPYYTAIQALEIEKQDNKKGKEEAKIYFNNRAVEISEPAKEIVEKIRKYMD